VWLPLQVHLQVKLLQNSFHKLSQLIVNIRQFNSMITDDKWFISDRILAGPLPADKMIATFVLFSGGANYCNLLLHPTNNRVFENFGEAWSEY